MVPLLRAIVLTLLLSSVAAGAQPLHKKVLLIGIDGCRFDALMFSQAKNLQQLARTGAYSDLTDVLGDRKTGAATITGPGWSSALTGAWADRHGVRDNAFRQHNLQNYPSFFHRLRAADPAADTVALVTWKPFQQFIFAADPSCRLVVDGDTKGYGEGDRQVTDATVKVLDDEDPLAVFAYFGEVDITGHGYGFHPRSPKYTTAIETVDGQVERILTALKQRHSYAQEDWLVMVCTDHGGRGKEHGIGDTVPEIRNGFLILSGPSVKPGQIPGRIFNVDVAVTALTHLGVAIQPEWKLDGKAVGLK
jgi:predicted AlkP superfamily pyrophosphatase or phosphodiesterase